jgi:3-hydroxymyristoyl/3-hydroxydecanoyl-(acyl carrier protein) dehydratase
MHFDLVDRELERGADRIRTVKLVTRSEEYLQDHFATFPVLPGVFMLESLVQAARRLVQDRAGARRLVLGGVRSLKYGRFVRPGDALVVTVEIAKDLGEMSWEFKGQGLRVEAGAGAQVDPEAVAVSGRFVLRPMR